MRAKEIEIVEIPMGTVRVAERRCRPMVAHTAALGRFGTIDLDALAISCYLQGIHDGIQLADGEIVATGKEVGK